MTRHPTPSDPASVTALYERARFGGTPPDPAEIADAEASLATLGRAAR